MKRAIYTALVIAAFFSFSAFNLENSLVPQDEILSGGPPKDGIPAILKPNFIKASEANFLKPDDRVIGVRINGEARAYPIKILNLHEAVNDTLSGQPFVVTF